MSDPWVSHRGRVVVITGGGGGIGSAAAVELAQAGAAVIAVDPGVGVTGEPLDESSAEETIASVRAAGGSGEASTVSVTDLEALRELFFEIKARYGRLDAVINPAGILRYPTYTQATAEDWADVLDVHLGGYLNVLTAALPIMETAGEGRIVGFTSGAGLARSSPDGPAYGTAKRAIASLTWELSDRLPLGVSVNAISPIAATRMVREAMIAAGMDAGGGLDLSAMPQAEDMAPLVSYLASDRIGWSRGNVVYSAGSEISPIGPPRMIEAMRTGDCDFGRALDTLMPVVLSAAEAGQRTTGGANPRFGQIFARVEPSMPNHPDATASGCLVVTDDTSIGERVAEAVSRWGLAPLGVGPTQPFDAGSASLPSTFEAVEEVLARASAKRAIETIVVAQSDTPAEAKTWSEVVDEHRTVADRIRVHAAWARAAGRLAERSGRPLRIAFVTDALSTAGRSTAQAVAQLARSINDTPSPTGVLAYAVACESSEPDDRSALAELVARLLRADDAVEVKGTELTVRPGWIAQKSHPRPLATASFGGPAIPVWVDTALREAFGV